jgi:hypothetical protein
VRGDEDVEFRVLVIDGDDEPEAVRSHSFVLGARKTHHGRAHPIAAFAPVLIPQRSFLPSPLTSVLVPESGKVSPLLDE